MDIMSLKQKIKNKKYTFTKNGITEETLGAKLQQEEQKDLHFRLAEKKEHP